MGRRPRLADGRSGGEVTGPCVYVNIGASKCGWVLVRAEREVQWEGSATERVCCLRKDGW